MKKIILDHLMRRWFIWAACCLIYLGVGLSLAWTSEPQSKLDVFLFFLFTAGMVPWITAVFIRVDWETGIPRILLSLPFTAKQIGRAFWWAGVGVPALLFPLASGMGILILNLAGKHERFLEPWLEMMFANGLLSGSLFWFFSGVPLSLAESRQKRFLELLFGCAFIIGLIGGIYFLYESTISSEIKILIAYFFGSVFTVLGWLRAEGLVVGFGGYRREIAGAGQSRGEFKPRSGFGGVSYLMIRVFARYLAVALIFFVVLAGLSFLLNHRLSWTDFISKADFQHSDTVIFYEWFQVMFFVVCFFFQIIAIGPHLRFLRSLPLTSKELAATILCVGVLPILILAGVSTTVVLMTLGLSSVLSLLKCYLLSLAPACAFVTAAVSNSEKRFKLITGVILALIVSAVPLIYQSATTNPVSGSRGLPIWVVIGVPAASLLIALLTIIRSLERNEMTYRIKLDPSGNRRF